MERNILWMPWDGPGLEHLRLTDATGDILADGVIIGVADGANRRLDLYCDGAGHWADDTGAELPGLAGCFDIDISVTPFTNSLPIRRLLLSPGVSADITVVYIDLPALTVQPEMQRYTRLAGDIARYRFEARSTGFTADLPVDADGLVQDYPGLFRRIDAPPAPCLNC